MRMRQKSGGRELTADPRPIASEKATWISQRHAARELGIDLRSVPKVAVAAPLRIKKVPGVLGYRYFLPDVERVARESVE